MTMHYYAFISPIYRPPLQGSSSGCDRLIDTYTTFYKVMELFIIKKILGFHYSHGKLTYKEFIMKTMFLCDI